MKILLASSFVLVILASSFFFLQSQDANAISLDNSYQQIVLPNGTATNYRLTNNATAIQLETQEGSYIFNEQTCTLYKYPKGLIGNQSPEFTDSYLALASNTSNGTSGWNPVGAINNAACSAYTVTNSTTVWITGTKTVAGAGSFSVTYMKAPQKDLKITISATNNNAAWTNYHLGLRELLQHVSGNVTLGDTTYDLSQHNNTGLNRAFISTHNAQFINLDLRTSYTMGLGWGNANSITDVYHVGNPALQIDYTFNTPILSPGSTITIDPSITKDTTNYHAQAAGSFTSDTQSITIANNANRILVVGVATYTTSPPQVTSVTFNGVQLHYLANTNGTNGLTRNSIWYLINPTATTANLIANFGTAATYDAVGFVSLYNVNQVTGIQNGNVTAKATSPGLAIGTPTKSNSWGLGFFGFSGGGSAPSDTQLWYDSASGVGGGEYRSSMTANIKQVLSYTTGANYAGSFAEVLVATGVPSTPTLTHINTLNSTAVKIDYPAQTGATYYLINYTTPASGSTWTQINQSALTKTINGLIPGTQYAAKIAAGNSSGTSSFTLIKSNYTTNIAPTSLTLTSVTSNSARISWTPPSGNLTGYKIEKSPNNSTWSIITLNTGNTTSRYDLTGLNPATLYYTRVSTYFAGGSNYSGYSSPTNPFSFSTSSLGSAWTTISRTSYWDIFSSQNNNNTITSWYRLAYGSNTINKILGLGVNSVTLLCTPNSSTNVNALSANGSLIYYMCGTSLNHFNLNTGTNTHDFSTVADQNYYIFPTFKQIYTLSSDISGGNCAKNNYQTSSSGNTTYANSYFISTVNTQYAQTYPSCTPVYWSYNMNTTTNTSNPSTSCSLIENQTSGVAAVPIDSVACDFAIPQKYPRYWNGLLIQNATTVSSNSTLSFLTNINTNNFKRELTTPPPLFGLTGTGTYVSFKLHTPTDYLVFLNGNNIYYAPMSSATSSLNTLRQSYYITTTAIGSTYAIPSSPAQSMKLYGPGFNSTVNKFGLMTLFYPYTTKGTSIESAVRVVDPRWTNDNTNIPLVTTTGSLFSIDLTMTNAPTNATLMVTYPTQIINSISGVWTITLLDATHSAEFDIPAGQCGNIYINDASQAKPIWLYQGNICATGINQKTVQYSQTLPLAFYSSIYGATSNYTPSTNGLETIVRATNSTSYIPFTYNVIVKNSTGVVALNQTFTSSTPLATQNFNVSGISKTASLYITVNGKQLYSSYLGASISFATIVSFFHQYLSYQGFDMLAFIPIVFASMFTRNTVGVGMAMTVVLIASMSWLSIEVVSDTIVYISILVAIIGMIGYRSLYG